MAVPTLGFAPGVLRRRCQRTGCKQLPYKWGGMWGKCPGARSRQGQHGCWDVAAGPTSAQPSAMGSCSLRVPRSFFCWLAESDGRQSLGVSPRSCSGVAWPVKTGAAAGMALYSKLL